IESANQLINKITGKNVTLFRPPYGSYNKSVLRQTNLSAVNWTVDTNDWRYRTSAPVVQNVSTYAHDGAIILMHDIHQWSVDAVPQIIKNLKAQGYTFVTVSTLLTVQDGGAKAQQVY
ncbi:polysaccharide deacetylase family protein, partial [Virgibacillus salexigens]